MSLFILNALFILLARSELTGATKWLIDYPGFNDPTAWEDEYIPCAKETVIFPETYQALLPLPNILNVGGFVLPKDGAILLQQEATIVLGNEASERDCDKGKGILKEPLVRKWFDPRTWRSSQELQNNKAIPDMERVPCNNESVIIKSNGPLSFDLEYTPYLRLGQLSFAGSLLSKDYLKQLLYTDVGQYLFKNQEGVNIEYYHNDVCGCHKDFNTFNEPICHNIVDTCPRPHCLVPVVPYGSCCAICGSVLRFSFEYCENDKVNIVNELIKKELKKNSLEEDLDFYVNYVNLKLFGNFLQVIIVDHDSYSEKSVNFMKYLNATTNWVKELNLQASHLYGFEFSGRPYNPNVSFGSILLIFFCLIFVAVVALVIFAHYKPDNQLLHYIPGWVYNHRLWRILVNRSNNVFARFDNTRASIQTISAEGNTRREFSVGFDHESGKIKEQAFDNPMFGEAASTSRAIGIKDSQEDKQDTAQNVPQLLIESIDLVDSQHREGEEQELTEIKLESSSDDDDEEQESKE